MITHYRRIGIGMLANANVSRRVNKAIHGSMGPVMELQAAMGTALYSVDPLQGRRRELSHYTSTSAVPVDGQIGVYNAVFLCWNLQSR